MLNAMIRGKMAAVLCLGSLMAASVHIGASENQQAKDQNQELDGRAIAVIIEEVAPAV